MLMYPCVLDSTHIYISVCLCKQGTHPFTLLLLAKLAYSFVVVDAEAKKMFVWSGIVIKSK